MTITYGMVNRETGEFQPINTMSDFVEAYLIILNGDEDKDWTICTYSKRRRKVRKNA